MCASYLESAVERGRELHIFDGRQRTDHRLDTADESSVLMSGEGVALDHWHHMDPPQQWTFDELGALTPPPIPELSTERVPFTSDPYSAPSVSGSTPQLQSVGGRLISVDSDLLDILPHDNTELSRLNFQHHLLHMALKGHYVAPLGEPGAQPRFFLDAGCGTGTWCQDMAHRFPDAAVFGIDAFDTGGADRRYLFRRSNLLDAEDTTLRQLTPGTFDYVHLRDLALAIPGSKSRGVIERLARLLRNGGWMEWVEFSIPVCTYQSSHQDMLRPIRLLGEWASAAAATGRGLVTNLVTTLADSMQRAGLIVTTVQETPLPLGAEIATANPEFYDWHYGTQAKRIGRLALANWMERMVALRPTILTLRMGGCTPQIFDQTLNSVPSTLTTYAKRGGNYYWPVLAICAQKPRTEDEE
jgi:SAM-dependent methyltransferase